MTQKVDTIISARHIVPVVPGGTFVDHALVIHQGRILDLLPKLEAGQKYSTPDWKERPHHTLIPGLVNAHTHLAMTLFRGMADDLPLQEWLREHIWPAEQEWVGPDFVRDGSELGVAEMICGGTTCASDMYFFPEVTARSAAAMGMRMVVGMPIIELETAWAKSAEECFAKGLQVHDAYRGHPLISTAFAPHAPYTVSDSSLIRISKLANELELPVHMHVHETAGEVADALLASGERPMARLKRLGLLTRQLVAVHMTCLDEQDIAMATEGNISVVHCPESNMKLASGICRVAELAEKGINVCLGTDGAASNNNLSMIGEMRSAALLGKVTAANASALSAADILAMATINGARALGMEDQIGSLERGKWADICCVDMHALHMQPLYDPISQLVFCAESNDVCDVWIGGRQLMDSRRLGNVNQKTLFDKAAQWSERLSGFGINR
ncbi:MAG: TRZ/ATZ family hydrolase [Gammaproteobacteria bacterium]|nr:TRZ/ATZ family hydrolase [Gammaproteobacteria bacterium]